MFINRRLSLLYHFSSSCFFCCKKLTHFKLWLLLVTFIIVLLVSSDKNALIVASLRKQSSNFLHFMLLSKLYFRSEQGFSASFPIDRQNLSKNTISLVE